ncbi:MAG: diaminopimelate decarboxylase, partial [Micrococcales bacterium]|nr:diaminopimelate decarboxylase [Micrococcales bacterium]
MRTHEAGALHGAGDGPAWLLVPEDVNALLPALWPASTHKTDDGELHIAGLGVTSIAAQVGTPSLVVDEADLRSRARAFREAFTTAFAPLGGAEVSYAIKALPTRAVVRWVGDEGLGLDVCTGGELGLALSAGADPARITFHGNNKSAEEIARALKAGVGKVAVDSLSEIPLWEAAAAAVNTVVNVLVRVRVGVEAHTHEYIATAHEDQKFGISLHDGSAAEAARRIAASPHLVLSGFHSHIGSQVFDAAGFAEAIRRLVGLHAEVTRELGQAPPILGLGGGFGVAYTTGHDPLPPDQLASQMARCLAGACADHEIAPPRVCLEPGRAIAGPAGLTLYTVGTVKKVALPGGFDRLYVAVDGGMSDNIRTALYSSDYSATLASRRSTAPPVLARVVGKHCESGDIIVKDEYLPADIAAGDLLAVPVTGAYCHSLASNYNLVPRPPVVAVNDKALTVIVRR